jgi:lipopolysaccharide O-acetyltransferase
MQGILQRYGLLGMLRLARDLIHTKIFYPGARIVRVPAYVRGARHIRWGANFTTGVGLRLDAFPDSDIIAITIGNDVQVNDYVHIAAIQNVSIGDHSLIASKVFISDHNHGQYAEPDSNSHPDTPPAQRPLVSKPVRIGARVWIGEHVCIMPGVTIGDGAIIGAGAVVTNDIPANTIAVGSPARVVKYFETANEMWQQKPSSKM